MAKRTNPFSRVRLVYRRSKPLTKVVVTVAIVLSMAALISLGAAKRSALTRLDQLHQQAIALTQANEALNHDIFMLGSEQSVQKIAQDELDLVMPGTTFFHTGE